MCDVCAPGEIVAGIWLLAWLLLLAPPGWAATFTVNAVTDASDAAPGDGTCGTGGTVGGTPECTLRAAIEEANVLNGPDSVAFALPVPSAPIRPGAPLPTITEATTIDGYTQPGASPNGNPLELGSNAVVRVEIDGSLAGSSTNGLVVHTGGSTIRGLAIHSFQSNGLDGNGFAIVLDLGDGNRVEGCFIGLTAAGASGSTATGSGIGIFGASGGNVIGGSAPSQMNVIAANGGNGVLVSTGSQGGNDVRGNLIGTTPDGLGAAGNRDNGIFVDAPDNTLARNVVSANGRPGVYLGAKAVGNQVWGNFVGTTASGFGTLGNGEDGIAIAGGRDNDIGGLAANVVGGNVYSGIVLFEGATANVVRGNHIGVGRDGVTALPNGGGVWLLSSGNTLGGPAPSDRNVIAGNNGHGVLISDGAANNLVLGNFIGTDATGAIAVPNTLDGVVIRNAGSNEIGRPVDGAGAINVIAGNARHGVRVEGSTATLNAILGNLIGVSVSGAPLGNQHHGVLVRDASGNRIGGTGLGEGNEIAHNGSALGRRGHGVVIEMSDGEMAVGNAIRANRVHDNTGRGIDLGNDTLEDSPNDPDDFDRGPNERLNMPVVKRVAFSGTSRTITFELDVPAGTYALDLFANAVPDPSGFGEGERHLITVTVTVPEVDPSGGPFSQDVSLPCPGGDCTIERIAATLTDADGNTSEFSMVDTDGDALADAWEAGDGTIDVDEDGLADQRLNCEHVDGPCVGLEPRTDPFHKTVLVEIDAMVGRMPSLLALGWVRLGRGFCVGELSGNQCFEDSDCGLGSCEHLDEGFGNAPAGLVGHYDGRAGIDARFVRDETDIPRHRWTSSNVDFPPEFDRVKHGPAADGRQGRFGTKAERAHARWPSIQAARRLAYHYALFADYIAGDDYTGGEAELPGNDFYCVLGKFVPPGGTPSHQAACLMHELGHNLGLPHGGTDHLLGKPNYKSVMNYTWAFEPAAPLLYRLSWTLDYSRDLRPTPLPVLFENGISEALGFGGNPFFRVPIGPRRDPVSNEKRKKQYVPEGGSLDLSIPPNGTTNDIVMRDVNFVSLRDPDAIGLQPLAGHEDWSTLDFALWRTRDFADGVHEHLPPGEPTIDDLEDLWSGDEGPGQLQFSFLEYETTESATFAVVRVSRRDGVTGTVSAAYGTQDGSATAGADYEASSGRVVFADGEYQQVIMIPVAADAVNESPETVILRLDDPHGGATLGEPSEATLTITDPSRFVVTNTDDALPGSLRQAILDANAHPGTDVISFDIPGSPPFIIQTASDLPAITDPVEIDATTQPGWVDRPIVQVRGRRAPNTPATVDQSVGLTLTAGGTLVRGLSIVAFERAMEVGGPGFDRIEGNYIGTDLDGITRFARVAIHVTSSDNVFGGTAAAARNVILSENQQDGFAIEDGDRNQVLGNFIGLAADGTTHSGGGLRIGIGNLAVGTADDNVIGGADPGAGNVIMFVQFRLAKRTVFQGNFVATDATGSTTRGLGFLIIGGSSDSLIGGTAPGAGNVFGGQGTFAVLVEDIGSTVPGSRNRFEGNRFGVAPDGVTPLIGTRPAFGILVNGGPGTPNLSDIVVGGLDPAAGNVFAYLRGDGITIDCGTVCRSTTVLSNQIFLNGTIRADGRPAGIGIDRSINTPQPPRPALTVATGTMTELRVDGTLTGMPNAPYTIQLFDNRDTTWSGQGQGEAPLATFGVSTNGAGAANFTRTMPVFVPDGHWVTATATEPSGNTSEFSTALRVAGVVVTTTTTSTTSTSTTSTSTTGTPTTTTTTLSSCGAAGTIPPEGGMVSDTTVGRLSQLSGSCGGTAAPEVVYAWVPSFTGTVQIDTCIGTSFDTIVYLRRDTCASAAIACNDNGCGLQSQQLIFVTAGRPYFIVVDGAPGASGTFTLRVTPITTTTTTSSSTSTTTSSTTTSSTSTTSSSTTPISTTSMTTTTASTTSTGSTTTSTTSTSDVTTSTTSTTTTSSSSSTTRTMPTARCPRTVGFWKKHPEAWPLTTLTLGSQSYDQSELLAVLKTSATGDASLILADQLIAARLNIASGSDALPVATTLVSADTLLAPFGGRLPYRVRAKSPTGQAMVSAGNVLESYNRGEQTPNCMP